MRGGQHKPVASGVRAWRNLRMRSNLCPHPAERSTALDELSVEVERPSASALRFRYIAIGRLDELVIPDPAEPLRTDHLWQTTCFEAFLRPPTGSAYVELNFSPSGQWAAYDFTAYRAGMVQLCVPEPPRIEVSRSAGRLEIDVRLSLDLPAESYALALAAVIEERSGCKSYWAANHAGDAPDFHHPSCFVHELPPAA